MNKIICFVTNYASHYHLANNNIMNKNNEDRLVWVDSLKGILMLLVVLGHSIQFILGDACSDNYLWNLIYSFHMPAFIAVSGFVCYKPKYYSGKGSKDFIFRRLKQLIVPFILWSLLRILANPPYSIMDIVSVFLHPDGGYWFLWVLFIITMIFYLVDWISEKTKVKQEYIVITTSLVLMLVMLVTNFRLFGYQFISYYFLFYIIGYYFNKYNQYFPKKIWFIFVGILVWFITASFWNMHELPFFFKDITFIPKQVMQYAYRFFVAVIAIITIFTLSSKILNVNFKINNFLLIFGKLSLGIYTSHIIIMSWIVKALYSLLPEIDTTNVILLSFIFISAISYCIVLLLNKFRITSRLLLGKISSSK